MHLVARACIVALLASFLPITSVAAAPHAQLTIGEQQEPGTLNPVLATLAVESDAFNLIFDGLFRNDAAGNLVPDLAARVPTQANGDISRDGRTITYHLVANARWHDGVPVTSDDVKFTYEAIMDPRNTVISRNGYDEIERLETPSPSTVVLHLKRAWAPIVEQIFTTKATEAIVPAHLLRGIADFNRAAYNALPVGSGPYRIVAWHRGQDMVFEANPAYFHGAPKIARIVWKFIPNESTLLNALRSGELDFVDRLGPAPYAQMGSVPGFTGTLGPSLGWEHLIFNTETGPLTDVRVRQALCRATNVHDLLAKIVHGIGDVGVGLINPHAPYYLRSLEPCAYDPAAAAKLLDDAGWPLAADGMRRNAAGKPLQLTFGTVAGMIDREQTQVILQSSWKALGIETTLRTFPAATFFAPMQAGGMLYSGKLDVGLGANYLDADPSHVNLLSSDRIPPAGQNLARWKNARVTELETLGASTYDVAQRRRAYDEIQRIVAREVPYLTLRWRTAVAMHKNELIGVKPSLVGSTFWNVNAWTF